MILAVLNYGPHHEDVQGSGDIIPGKLLGTRWRSVVGYTLRPFYPQEKASDTHWAEDRVGLRPYLDTVAIIKVPSLAGTKPQSSSPHIILASTIHTIKQ